MAGKLKQGAQTGFFDMNNTPICAGDTIVAPDGSLWDVNCYMQVVPQADGMARKLREFGAEHCSIFDKNDERQKIKLNESTSITTAPMIEPEPEPEFKPERTDLTGYSEEELVEELRRRGVEVKARKQILMYVDL